MAHEDKEIRIDATPVISSYADEAVRMLARLIGRQMAREQFGPEQAIVRKHRHLAETDKSSGRRQRYTAYTQCDVTDIAPALRKRLKCRSSP